MKSPEYLKLNPFGKVPVLVDGDVVIYELGASTPNSTKSQSITTPRDSLLV
jgi:hypothetical protein